MVEEQSCGIYKQKRQNSDHSWTIWKYEKIGASDVDALVSRLKVL